MMQRSTTSLAIDASAITLSGLCIIHCLALPLLAAVLPLAGVFAGEEWVHKLFVALALPLSGFAIARGSGRGFISLAMAGLALLMASAFIEGLHEFEAPLTVLGALLLASAHVWRWIRHRRDPAEHEG